MRARMSAPGTKLFQGFEICLSGIFNEMQKDDLQLLLVAEGAKIARSIHSVSFKAKCLIVVEEINDVNADADRHFRAFNLATVNHHW